MSVQPRSRYWLLAIIALAHPGWAGQRDDAAWLAEYRWQRAETTCQLTLVRSPNRIEYRGCGPTRVWRRLDDGIELVELHPQQGYMVRYSPGDLRAMGQVPQWHQLGSIVPADLPQQLQAGRRSRVLQQAARRYRGHGMDGRNMELLWLDALALPASYRIVDPHGRETLVLEQLRQAPAASVFTALDLTEKDAADLADTIHSH